MRAELRRVKVADLQPNEWNFNEMTPQELATLKESLKEFGYKKPIVCLPNGNKYTIIDGEHRWKALKKLGAEEVEIVVLYGVSTKDAVEITSILNIIRPDNEFKQQVENKLSNLTQKPKFEVALHIDKLKVKVKNKEIAELLAERIEKINAVFYKVKEEIA